MDSWQQLGSQALPPTKKADFMNVTFCFDTGVSVPSVCMHDTTGFDGGQQEGLQTRRRGIRDSGHAYPADSFTVFLRRNHNHCLGTHVSATNPFFRGTSITIVYLHTPTQSVSSRPNHRPTQFVQPCPRCLVTAQSQNPLDPQGTGAGLLAGHQPDPAKPQSKRLVRVLENRSGCNGCLKSARGTSYQTALRKPSPLIGTSGTRKTIGPLEPEEVLPARLFRGKPTFEFQKRSRVVLHATILHLVVTGVKEILLFSYNGLFSAFHKSTIVLREFMNRGLKNETIFPLTLHKRRSIF